jgi:adenine-specific DNA-methyltransferase
VDQTDEPPTTRRNYRGGGDLTPNLSRARRLRHEQTDAEARLWHHLRAGQLYGLKFRRQHPFGPFILDFYCATRKLTIELDGDQHASVEGIVSDERRSAYLSAQGIRVLRFSDYDALTNTEGLLLAIL